MSQIPSKSDKETFDTWNKMAELYESKFMDLDLYNDTYDFVCQSLPNKNAKILDVGCGPGNIARYLLSKRPDFKLVGLDVAPKMIELAKKNNPSADFKVMDVRNMHELETNFDGIINGFCLPYLSEKESFDFIRNSYDVLNENGWVYISFVEGDPSRSDYKTGSSGDRVYFYFHQIETIQNQLKESGFSDIKKFLVTFQRTETTQEIHTIVTARKTPFVLIRIIRKLKLKHWLTTK